MISRSAILSVTAPPRTPCDACAPFGVGTIDAQGNDVSPHFARYVCSFYVRIGVAVRGVRGRTVVRTKLALVKYGACDRGDHALADKLVKAAMLHSVGARA